MSRLFCLTALVSLNLVSAAFAVEGDKIKFKKVVLDDKFRSEGVCVADFNRDGKLDVGAGRVWYAAPDWKMSSFEAGEAKAHDPNGYSGSFCNFADDINGDGWADHILVDFPGTPTYWYENPKGASGPWKRHVAAPVSNNESPNYLDLDGDGKKELVMGVAPKSEQSDGPDRQMAFVKPNADPTQPWKIIPISKKAPPGTQRYSHGLGIGDVNRDGRNDVVVPEGWWEAPTDRTANPWTFHAAPLGAACAHMVVFDFDGDGDNDIVSSSAHDYGVWYYEQRKDGDKTTWKKHEIDTAFSQSHSLVLADMNDDGLPDLVTGKRWWAHGPKGDKGAGEPAMVYWFELRRENGQAKWTKREVDRDSGIGTQFEVVDMNGDKLLDIVTANKKGARVFLQER